MSVRLIRPTMKYQASFRDALREFLLVDGKNEGDPEKIGDLIVESRRMARGVNLPKGKVQTSIFWLMDDDDFVGRVRLSHRLNRNLRNRGGHIGYIILPSKRNLGYGVKILMLALSKARKLGLKKVLLTCDEGNIASRKIIERNGGRLQKTALYKGRASCYYWIDVG